MSAQGYHGIIRPEEHTRLHACARITASLACASLHSAGCRQWSLLNRTKGGVLARQRTAIVDAGLHGGLRWYLFATVPQIPKIEEPERVAKHQKEWRNSFCVSPLRAEIPKLRPPTTASGQQKQPATLVTRKRRHVSVTPQVRQLSLVFRGAVSRRVLEPILTQKNP